MSSDMLPGDPGIAPNAVFVDLAFRIQGERVPLDHGYLLYSALSRCLPALHANAAWGVHPIRGLRSSPDRLRVLRSSRLKLRLPADAIAAALPLAGQTIAVGTSKLPVGTPDVFVLRPHTQLRARLVIIKGFHEDTNLFIQAVRRQLAACAGEDAATRAQIDIGPRRIMHIHGRKVVGFAVGLDDLDEHTSLLVQATGIGGKRRMGCGIFVPPGKRARGAATAK